MSEGEAEPCGFDFSVWVHEQVEGEWDGELGSAGADFGAELAVYLVERVAVGGSRWLNAITRGSRLEGSRQWG